jgi:hypothetical protein
MDHSSPKYFK